MSSQLTAHRTSWLPVSIRSLAIAGSLISVALVLATVGLTVVSRKLGLVLSGGGASGLVDTAAFGLLGGVLVARRPANAIGWLMLVIALSQGANGLTTEDSTLALVSPALKLPAADLAAWGGGWIWAPGLGLLVIVVLLIFPD